MPCGWSSDDEYVDVVVVVGRRAAAVRHGPPTLRRALGGPDLLLIDDLDDPQLAAVRLEQAAISAPRAPDVMMSSALPLACSLPSPLVPP